MANVTNNFTGPLNIGGVTIPAGRTAKAEKWSKQSATATEKTWLELGIISADGDEPEADAPSAGEYAVKQTSSGWFAIFKGDEQVTKALRRDALAGFDTLTVENQAAFVEANKVEA